MVRTLAWKKWHENTPQERERERERESKMSTKYWHWSICLLRSKCFWKHPVHEKYGPWRKEFHKLSITFVETNVEEDIPSWHKVVRSFRRRDKTTILSGPRCLLKSCTISSCPLCSQTHSRWERPEKKGCVWYVNSCKTLLTADIFVIIRTPRHSNFNKNSSLGVCFCLWRESSTTGLCWAFFLGWWSNTCFPLSLCCLFRPFLQKTLRAQTALLMSEFVQKPVAQFADIAQMKNQWKKKTKVKNITLICMFLWGTQQNWAAGSWVWKVNFEQHIIHRVECEACSLCKFHAKSIIRQTSTLCRWSKPSSPCLMCSTHLKSKGCREHCKLAGPVHCHQINCGELPEWLAQDPLHLRWSPRLKFPKKERY